MNKLSVLSAVMGAVFALSGCGGGGGTQADDGFVSVSLLPEAQFRAGEVIRIAAQIHSYKNLLQTVQWTVLPGDSNSPALTITNQDCASGEKSDSSFSTYKESTWVCEVQALAPTGIQADAQYTFTVNGRDTAGNLASSKTAVVVKPVPVNTNPLVASVDPASVALKAGDKAALGCSAQGGYLSAAASYTYSWKVSRNPAAIDLTLVNSNDGSVRFTAPDVTLPTPVEIECVATDSTLRAAAAYSIVTINPIPTPTPVIVADAGAAQTVKTGTAVTLDGSKSKISVKGVDTGAPLYYKWEQLSGPNVALAGATTVKPSFLAPASTATSQMRFRLRVDSQPITTQEVQPSADTETAVYVSGVTPLGVTVAAPTSKIDPGSLVALQAVVTGNDTNSTLYYSWTQIAGPSVTLSGTNSPNASFLAPDITSPGVVTLRVRVARSPSEMTQVPPSAVTDVSIPVAGYAPLSVMATGPGEGGASAGAFVSAQAFVTGASDGEMVYYQWKQLSGPAITLYGSTNQQVSFYAPPVTEETIITLRVMVARSEAQFPNVPSSAITEIPIKIFP